MFTKRQMFWARMRILALNAGNARALIFCHNRILKASRP